MAVAGVVLAVAALVLFGRAVHTTTELVRLLRSPAPATTAVETSARDGMPLDALAPIGDASLDAPSAVPLAPGDDVRPPIATRLDTGDARTALTIPTIAETLAPAPPENAVPQTAAPGATGGVVDASADASSPKDAAPERAERPARDAAPIRCGQRTCPEGQECCNWACSICVSPGETCSLSCGNPSMPISAPCGPNTCNVGEICCNASCGICVPAGGTCSKEPCPGMYLPVSPTCGMNTCNAGQYCCNPSCGICVNQGETCSSEPCR